MTGGRASGMSIQIVETAQINVTDAAQASVMAAATHFNPVDLACATKRRDGSRYPLVRRPRGARRAAGADRAGRARANAITSQRPTPART